MKPVRLAIFDIDGTIFRSSLIIEVFNALVADGVFPKKASERVERNYLRWLNRKGHYNDYLMRLVFEFFRNLKGRKASDIEPIVNRVVRWQKDRVYRFTRDLSRALKKHGYLLVAISNSPDIMVGPFARSAGFSVIVGRTYEIINGRYTGRITINGRPLAVNAWVDKVALLNEVLAERGVRANLAESIAVGDSEGDAAILGIVGNPIAFNPSAQLADLARRRGWQVVVERKDVTYIIQEAGMIAAKEHQNVHIHMDKSKKRKR